MRGKRAVYLVGGVKPAVVSMTEIFMRTVK